MTDVLYSISLVRIKLKNYCKRKIVKLLLIFYFWPNSALFLSFRGIALALCLHNRLAKTIIVGGHMEQIEMMLEKFSILQLLGIGALLAVIVHLTFLRKTLIREIKDAQDKNRAKRESIFRKWLYGGKDFRSPVTKQVRDVPRQAGFASNLMREHFFILNTIERAISWVYQEWHHIPAWERLLLCLPFGLTSIVAFFFANFPVFLGAQSFHDIPLLVYLAQFTIILMIHTTIYLLMSRFRFLISGGVVVFFTVLLPVMVRQFMPAFFESNFIEIFIRGGFHIVAAILIAWIWVKVSSNKPGAIFRLLGVEFIMTGICNVGLTIFMLFNVPRLAHETSPDQVLSFPLYHSFEPLLRQVMTPLHLYIGDFVPENMTLAVLLLTWGGLLFCLGGFMWLARYDEIAAIPEEVKSLTLYT